MQKIIRLSMPSVIMLFIFLILNPFSAQALLVEVGSYGPDEVIITDNGIGDLDPMAGIIKFNETLMTSGFTASDTVTETISSGKEAVLTLTDLTVLATRDDVHGVITFEGSEFDPITPESYTRVQFGGEYTHVSNPPGSSSIVVGDDAALEANFLVSDGAYQVDLDLEVVFPVIFGVPSPILFGPVSVGL